MKTKNPKSQVVETNLSPVGQKFVLHWGEMGTKWGVNRTVAQIHALLFISEKPLTAEEIVDTLSISRSNVGASIKELESWKLVKVISQIGSRKEYFETSKDVWELFKIVMEGRKQREIDPTRSLLKECMSELGKVGSSDKYLKERLTDLNEFVETSTSWVEEIQSMSTATIRKIMKLGSKIQKVLG